MVITYKPRADFFEERFLVLMILFEVIVFKAPTVMSVNIRDNCYTLDDMAFIDKLQVKHFFITI
jgi:hypothetical protein